MSSKSSNHAKAECYIGFINQLGEGTQYTVENETADTDIETAIDHVPQVENCLTLKRELDTICENSRHNTKTILMDERTGEIFDTSRPIDEYLHRLVDAILNYSIVIKVIEDSSEEVKSQDTTTDNRVITPCTKVAQKIKEVADLGEEAELDIASAQEKRLKKLLKTVISVIVPEELTAGLQPFDVEVHKAVMSLWAKDQRLITGQQIYKEFAHTNRTPTPKQLEEVHRAMAKLRRTEILLEYGEELTRKPNTSGIRKFKGRMLVEADSTMLMAANGQIVPDGYELKRIPPVLEHALEVNQIMYMPSEPLQIKGLRLTDENVTIRNYIYDRIGLAQRQKKSTETIRYSTITKHIDAENITRKKAQKVRETVYKVLDGLVENGAIEKWTEQEEKGSSHRKTGVILTLKKGEITA